MRSTFKNYLTILIFLSVACSQLFTACSESEEPEPDPIAPEVTYEDITVDLGGEFSVEPTVVKGDLPITYAIKDAGGAEDFVSIESSTGKITVAKESVIGSFSVVVSATNAAGTSDATAGITISIPDNFDPTGKTYEWKIFMNRSENIELTGLDGVPGLPFSSLVLPTEWPTASTPADELYKYAVLTGVQSLLLQVPGDNVCAKGNSLKFSVDSDFVVHAICSEGDPVSIGTSILSYKDDNFIFTLDLEYQTGLSIPYPISGAMFGSFEDVYTNPENPVTYTALQGTVNGMTTPSDLTNEETIQDITKWLTPTVDVVLEVIE